MSVKPVRQVTPPAARIWLAGLGATALAAGANAGWLWICVNLFNWEIVVPEAFKAQFMLMLRCCELRSNCHCGRLQQLWLLLVWPNFSLVQEFGFLVIGLGGGFASVYGALTLTGVSFSVKFSLSVMHLLATFLVVLPIAEALKIRDSDLHRADVRYHEHLESKNSDDTTFIAGSTAATTSSAIDAPKNLNDTMVVPTDSPTPDASGSFDGGGSAD
jgi:hypothetical protein